MKSIEEVDSLELSKEDETDLERVDENGETDFTLLDMDVEMRCFEEKVSNLDVNISEDISEANVSDYPRFKKTKKIPPHIKALIGEANLRFARGDLDTAEKLCYEVIRQHPKASDAFFTLSQIFENKDPEKSLKLLFMSAFTNKNIELWISTAEKSVQHSNYVLALTCYNFAIRLEKENFDLHIKRIQVLEKLGNKNNQMLKAFTKYLDILYEKNDKELINVSLKVAILYNEVKEYDKAIETLDKSLKKFPNLVTSEMVNIMLDLLINVENFVYCLDIFLQFCNIEIEIEINENNSVNVISCIVPDNIALDFRVKFIICLVKLDAFHLIEELLFPIFNYTDLDLVADLHLDLAEALMTAKKFDIALKIISPLIENDKLSLPAVWLKYGECLAGCNMYEKAEEAFKKVIESAPSYIEAKKLQADVLVKQGKVKEALDLLEQNPERDPIDLGLLLKRIDILRDLKLYDELFSNVELLFLRHCIDVKHYEELRHVLYSTNQIDKLTRLQELRVSRGLPEENPLTFTLTEEISVEEEYRLLENTLQLCFDQKNYDAMQKIAFIAFTSSRFSKKLDEIQLWAFYSSAYKKDFANSYSLIKNMLLHNDDNNFIWNLYGSVLQTSDNIRHIRFLMHYGDEHPKIKTLEANYCLQSGSFKLAMINYLNEIRSSDCTSLHLLVLASIFLGIFSQRFAANKEKLMFTCINVMIAYANIRNKEGVQDEVYYNMGRMYQQIGFSYLAEAYYKKVLDYESPLAKIDPNLSLKKEAAYNLHLIYLESGNQNAARDLMMKYLRI